MAPPSARGPSSRNQPAAEQPKRMTAAQLSNARAAAAADAARYSKVRTVPTAAAARIPQSKEGVGLTAAARTQAQVAVDSRTGTLGSQASNVTVVPGSGYQQPMQADQVDVSITGAGNKDADTEHISARSHPKPQHSTPGAGLSTPGVGVGVGASQSETAQAAAQHVELARSVSNDSEGTTPYSVATDEPNAPSNSDDYYSDGIGLDGALPGPHGPMPGHYSQCGLGHPAGASDYPYAGAGPVPLNMVPIPAAVQMGSQITSTTCQIITAQIIQPQPNLPPTLVFSTITQQQVAAANYIQQTVPMSVIPMYPGQPQAADPSYYVPGHSGYVPAPPDPTNDAAGHSPFGNANARASRHSAAAGPQPRAHQHMPPPMRPSQNQRSVPAPPDEADADESLSCAASDGGAGPYSLSEYSDGPSPATVLDESLNPNSDLPAPKMQTPSSK